MKIRPLAIEGAFEITPQQFPDDRGVFLESFRYDRLAEAVGRSIEVQQANVSVSARGVLRGIHFVDVPVGQSKFITVLAGSLIDFVVDLRVGSPTFGQWDSVRLDADDHRAVYLFEGLGHAFCALEDGTATHYMCSSTYNPKAGSTARARRSAPRRTRSRSACSTCRPSTRCVASRPTY